MNHPLPPFRRALDWINPAPGDSWSDDPIERLERARRVATMVAGVAVGVAVLEAVALAGLAPLKTVVPYAITVDRQTGYVETARTLQPGPLTQDQAIAQSTLVQYVMARETFDATDLRDAYRRTTLWSSGEAQRQYRQEMQRSNPASPLNLYPPTTVVSTTIKSVSMLSPGSALVRFDTTRRDAGATGGERRAWTAVVGFRYAGAPMRMEDRFLNPLGFQVLRYRRDAETIAPTPVRFDGPLGTATP
ncbi:MAG: VirB8/TrbF family protein [Caulobacteraceae bacterium]|nr:VirB8/TrbF family protein [Caulobacteraceae bacterium]